MRKKMKRNKVYLVLSMVLTVTLIILSVLFFNRNGIIGQRGNPQDQNKTIIGRSIKDNGNNVEAIPEKIPASPIEVQAAGKNNVKVKAIYLTGISTGNKTFLDKIVKIINTTELNAVVIDVKEDGKVNYESNVALVKETGAYEKLYDPNYVIKTLHDNGIYVIGRIVCFRDDYMAVKRPDLAIKRPDGSIWKENGKIAWTNPYNEDVWNYNIEVAKEAVEKGFDEVQFDYVRFPAASSTSVDYGKGVSDKADAISGFLKVASKEIKKMNATVSADVFAIICESPGDTEGIGQVLETIGLDVDYICPMIYPSHYANNSKRMMGNGVGQSINGVMFTAPDLRPYDVVYNALLKTKNRIAKIDGYNAKVRPYLQYFTASYLPKGYYQNYGPEQIRQQINAVYDAGYEEWIFWDAGNGYKNISFEKE